MLSASFLAGSGTMDQGPSRAWVPVSRAICHWCHGDRGGSTPGRVPLKGMPFPAAEEKHVGAGRAGLAGAGTEAQGHQGTSRPVPCWDPLAAEHRAPPQPPWAPRLRTQRATQPSASCLRRRKDKVMVDPTLPGHSQRRKIPCRQAGSCTHTCVRTHPRAHTHTPPFPAASD